MNTRKIALSPGTFDPITFGHIDVIGRAALLFDEGIVAVAASAGKHPLFTLDERTNLARAATSHIKGVRVEPFDTLLVDFAREQSAQVVVKGLRAVTDFEYEFQQAALNYQLDPGIETTFIMSPPKYMHLSSSIVRELAALGSDVSAFVPECVKIALEEKFENSGSAVSPALINAKTR